MGALVAQAQAQPQIARPQEPKSILLLYSASFYLPAYRKNIAAFFSVMEGAGFPVSRLHFEHLDLVRHSGQEYRRQLLAMLRGKYAGQKIDLIITVEGLARDLILKEGQDFLPEAPLLAILSADAIDPVESLRHVVQIPSVLDMAGTLEVGLSLFPKTKRVFVVVGTGEDEKRWERDAREKFAPWAGTLEFAYSSELTYEETLQRIGSLPADSIVIYIALYKDKTGRPFVPRDAAVALTRQANAPVFGIYDEITPLLVGGSMISYASEGARAATLALKILSGEFPLTEPLVTLPILNTPNFNWKQLERWGVSNRTLPEGSIVINRPASIWDDYREYVIGGTVLVVLQTGMILALLAMRRRSRIAESIRQKTEERYRRIVDTANEGIWTVDASLRNTFVNQKMADMLGYAPEEMIGQPYEKFLHREDLGAFHASMDKRKKGEGETYERRYLHKDGRVIWTLVNATPILDDHKRFVGAFAMYTDITARKQAEEEKAKTEAQLRQAQKMEAIGTLAGGIAHDFNNILGAILGYAELARDDAESGTPAPHDIDQIILSAERAKRLVQQIMAFSRKVEPERKPMDLNQEVRRSMELLEHTLPKMIATELQLSSDLKHLDADPGQLSQVIINLAANAFHAMPEGGKLTISTKNASFSAKLCPTCGETFSGDWVALTISDTGQGIHPNDLPRIFDPFFTTKEVGKGTGLGLSMVHGIIKSHGGHIECQSQLGQGTSFTIYLAALAQAEIGPRETDEENQGMPGGEETIMLVDDEDPLRAMGQRILTAMGYQVIPASSGEKAVELYRKRSSGIDLVVMDLGMPGMGGHKAMKAILELDPRAKVVIASGYAANDQVKAALVSGGAGYVAKPFKRAELLAMVRNTIDGK
jgi:PAS domain S-box-containing protein